FDRGATEAFVSEQDNAENLQLVDDQLNQPDWFANSKAVSAAAAFRATVPDHLPLAGGIAEQQGLYVLGAMGARGIMLSPLLAELLACQLCNEPVPLSRQLIGKITALRY